MAVAQRTRISQHWGRVVVIAVVLLVVLNLGIFLLANADTSPGGKPLLPSTVESISPERGEITGLLDDVTIDLADNLQGELILNGRLIPEASSTTSPSSG